jgi:uncharacterized membrane protein (DUF373 family)
MAINPVDSVDTTTREARRTVLVWYRRVLDIIVMCLIAVMTLTLLGALAGLIFDLWSAGKEFHLDVASHNLAHGVVDDLDRELVIDVLSVFVLIELFRTFTDFLEFQRVRLRVLTEVGIAFVLREAFIGLYNHNLPWPETLALTALLAVLIAGRVASVKFDVKDA